MDSVSSLICKWEGEKEVEKKYVWKIAKIFQILRENIKPHTLKNLTPWQMWN